MSIDAVNQKNIKKNYLYNLFYQIITLITPLITAPYVSRVLGSDGIGKFSFTYSLVSYFTLFASFGFNYYAQREIANNQGEQEKQSVIFWEIICSRIFLVIISLLIYFLMIIFGVFQDYKLLMMILSINIISVGFDISFLYQGNEEFGKIVIRNIITKIVGIILIFLFVRQKSDVWIYTMCHSIILIASNILLWFGLRKKVIFVSIRKLNIKKHFLPSLRLFIPTIAVSVYTMLDKTLIGLLVNGETIITNIFGKTEIVKNSELENGYYEQAEKIVKMVLTIITSLGTVMIPRNSSSLAKGKHEEFFNNINNALSFVCFIGFPLMFGLAAISFNFCPWFFGPGYEKVPYLIIIFCPLVIFIGFSNVLGLQYLIPLKKDKKYTIAICTGALLNVIINIFLIPKYKSYGAAFATIFAELIITCIMFYFARKDINIKKLFCSCCKYLLSGIVMFICIFLVTLYLSSSIINTIVIILLGCFIYLILLLLFRDKYIFGFINKVKNINKSKGK